jgi:uncharacterized membrane protein YraQ (UPF0718 family)
MEDVEIDMDTALRLLKRPWQWVSIFNDRAVALMVVLLATLLVLDSHQAAASIQFTGNALLQILPFFLLAILFAAYAKASGADRLIARAFSGNMATAIVAGALAGAFSPFCSCGVVPVLAGMLASGVPLAPVMAFCMASPIMDPEMFILTAAGIDVNFAIAKTITAVGMGLLAGVSVVSLQRLGTIQQPLKKASGCGCGQSDEETSLPVPIAWRFWREPSRRHEFISQLRTNGLFLGKWMTVAFLIESMMIAYVPAALIASWVGAESRLAIPLSALIGIPAYMNGYAAIPLISGFLDLGMTPGAALAFVTAGAVSSIPAALAVYALVNRSVFYLYVGVGVAGSLIAGYVYHLFHVM